MRCNGEPHRHHPELMFSLNNHLCTLTLRAQAVRDAAALACAQRGDDGVVRSISAPLPRWLSQTSRWAERVAAMMAKLFLPSGQKFIGRYVGDCVGAVMLVRDFHRAHR